MIQEIIVFALFGFIIAFYLYRFFISKSSHTGGCDKCASAPKSKQQKKPEHPHNHRQS